MEPTTIPAMAPPDRPPFFPATGTALDVELDPGVVPFVNMLPIGVVIGNLTPVHRVSVLEYRQHESVALGEVAEQYEQRLGRLPAKPQLSGSFCTPRIHPPERESAGSAQLVKSARICVMALRLVEPHRSGVEAICSSLVAYSACIMLALVKTY